MRVGCNNTLGNMDKKAIRAEKDWHQRVIAGRHNMHVKEKKQEAMGGIKGRSKFWDKKGGNKEENAKEMIVEIKIRLWKNSREQWDICKQ